jgi:hypothetical protein
MVRWFYLRFLNWPFLGPLWCRGGMRRLDFRFVDLRLRVAMVVSGG